MTERHACPNQERKDCNGKQTWRIGIETESRGMWVDELTVDQQVNLQADHGVFDPFRFDRPFNRIRPFS